MSAGDTLVEIEDAPVLTFGDFLHVYDQLDRSSTVLSLAVERRVSPAVQPTRVEIELELPRLLYDIGSQVPSTGTHASYTVRYGAGLFPLLFGLLGLAIALYRIDRRLAVFLAFPILYYNFYSSQKIFFEGNLMPVYPFLAILAGLAIADIGRRLEARVDRPGRLSAIQSATLVALMTALVLLFPIDMTGEERDGQHLPRDRRLRELEVVGVREQRGRRDDEEREANEATAPLTGVPESAAPEALCHRVDRRFLRVTPFNLALK